MKKQVLVLGRTEKVLGEALSALHGLDVELHGGSTLDDVRAVVARTTLDHVVMGAGIDLEVRLAIVRELFTTSDRTTVHMKDHASGPEGFLPFVRAVLSGLDSWR